MLVLIDQETQMTYTVCVADPLKTAVHDVAAPLETATPALFDGYSDSMNLLTAALPPPPTAKVPGGQVAVAVLVAVLALTTVTLAMLPPVAPVSPVAPSAPFPVWLIR